MTSTSSYAEGIDLQRELSRRMRDLDRAIEELKPRGTALSEAEAEYRIALASKIVDLRAEGTPVTIISDLARGDEGVATLKLKRDNAEVLYKSAMEAVNGVKKKIGIINDQIQREWSNASRG